MDSSTEGVVEVPLTRGRVAIIDAIDLHKVGRFKWRAHNNPGSPVWYAASERSSAPDGPYFFMHRVIMDAPKGITVDHRNLDGLDNRRQNLRLATYVQQAGNTRLRSNNTSGFRGVSYYRAMKKWEAKLCPAGRVLHLGYFEDPKDAARAYDEAAADYYGEFARLNFPQEGVVE